MPRLFTALEIPHNITASLALLRGGLPNARWLDTSDFHITLNFFSDVDAHIADEIVHELDKVSLPNFYLSVCGLDIFSRKKPSLLYAAITPSPELISLHDTINRKLRHLPLVRTKRSFIPHITLAHVKQTKIDDLIKYLSAHGGFTADKLPVKRFVLMSAREFIGGGPYLIEESWPLTLNSLSERAT